jgi:hypothetical protein
MEDDSVRSSPFLRMKLIKHFLSHISETLIKNSNLSQKIQINQKKIKLIKKILNESIFFQINPKKNPNK